MKPVREMANDLWVTDLGLELHYHDSKLREDISHAIFGVNEALFLGLLWVTKLPPPKSVTPEWLKSEDGMDFLATVEAFGNEAEHSSLTPEEIERLLKGPDEGPDDEPDENYEDDNFDFTPDF